jgi:HPt (histidine-containing phosphotransfer) domain-containing protein
MSDVSTATLERPRAASAASGERPIDLVHLARMTLGERSLEREVLALFDRQAEMLLPRIRRGDRAVAAASAHTLKGSAVGIGAFGVARAAEAVEQARDAAFRDATFAAAIDTLAAVLEEAKAEIARLLAN